MPETEFGMKEIEQVLIKSTSDIEINGQLFVKGEVVAAFDKIQLANFKEIKSKVRAHGGFDDRGLVFWEDTKEIQLNFSQGIFSKIQFGMMSNSKVIRLEENEYILISKREYLELDEDSKLYPKFTPTGEFFVYDEAKTHLRATEITKDGIKIDAPPFTKVIMDYQFKYKTASVVKLGHRMFPGFLSFEGKTRVKDDITGQTKTGIIYIPKLKLMSDMSIRLGTNASPVVGNFAASALPVGGKGDKKVMEIIFLDDDIDADIM